MLDDRGSRARVRVVFFVAVSVALFNASPSAALRDPHSPQLRSRPSDIARARKLLLVEAVLPHGFHAIVTGASPSNNGGSCGGVDPDLSSLTETAEAYGNELLNPAFGAYGSVADVFISPSEAARAQRLDTAPDTVACAASIAKRFLVGAHATASAQRFTFSARQVGRTRIVARGVVLTTRIAGRKAEVMASMYFLRRGRALSVLLAYGKVTSASNRTTTRAIETMSRNLARERF